MKIAYGQEDIKKSVDKLRITSPEVYKALNEKGKTFVYILEHGTEKGELSHGGGFHQSITTDKAFTGVDEKIWKPGQSVKPTIFEGGEVEVKRLINKPQVITEGGLVATLHSINSRPLTARLDRLANELEKIDPRIAMALDKVSDRLSKTAKDESFSHHLLKYINIDLQKFLKNNKEQEQALLTDINDAGFWGILDNAALDLQFKAGNKKAEDKLYDQLDLCPEWKKLMDPEYTTAKEWREDIKKLEEWVKTNLK